MVQPRSQFRSAQDYYATAFHEAAHSTGHPSRLNRPGITAFDHFGSDRYAREELVAEMTSSVLCAESGIDNPELFDNSAAYIAGWLSALNHERTLVVAAAAQAQRACDLINQAEHEAIRHANHPPEGATVAGRRYLSDSRAGHAARATEAGGGPAGPTHAVRGSECDSTLTRPAADPARQPPERTGDREAETG